MRQKNNQKRNSFSCRRTKILFWFRTNLFSVIHFYIQKITNENKEKYRERKCVVYTTETDATILCWELNSTHAFRNTARALPNMMNVNVSVCVAAVTLTHPYASMLYTPASCRMCIHTYTTHRCCTLVFESQSLFSMVAENRLPCTFIGRFHQFTHMSSTERCLKQTLLCDVHILHVCVCTNIPCAAADMPFPRIQTTATDKK